MGRVTGRILLAGVVASGLGLDAGRARAEGPARGKVVVEFGWDEPDTSFLRRHIEAMERAPFDGCVFHAVARTAGGGLENLAWKAWGRRAFTEEELAGAFEDLQAIRPKRFTANFLRINTTPADLDWFDEYSSVVANARIAARLARAGRSRGVLLDTEAYERPLFSYRKQRDAANRAWEDYADQARRRGGEVTEALQDGFPGLTVLLTFGPSLVRAQTEKGKRSPEDAPDGLLVPFVEGLVGAARGETQVIDGYELSYGYREPKRFDEALESIRLAGGPKVRAGFGLWLDYDWRAKGWDVDDPGKNHFTPEAFGSSVRAALERSDGVVWVYTETPRWWTEGDRPVKLPSAYVDALRQARRGLAAD
jgi:hypothetical protein